MVPIHVQARPQVPQNPLVTAACGPRDRSLACPSPRYGRQQSIEWESAGSCPFVFWRELEGFMLLMPVSCVCKLLATFSGPVKVNLHSDNVFLVRNFWSKFDISGYEQAQVKTMSFTHTEFCNHCSQLVHLQWSRSDVGLDGTGHFTKGGLGCESLGQALSCQLTFLFPQRGVLFSSSPL